MPLSETDRNRIANHKIEIERYRKDLHSLKEQKKQKAASYANMIKSTNDPNSKRSYRQSKISAINSLVNQIESKKRDIERVKGYIAAIKK